MFVMSTLTPESTRGSAGCTRWQTREARLRPEYGDLYPGIRPGAWEPAAILADRLLADRLLRGSEVAVRGRVLPETHFEFQGGASLGGERDGMRLGRIYAPR